MKALSKVKKQSIMAVTQQKFDSEKFLCLFQTCYENIQLSRRNRDRAHKMMKGMVAANSRHTIGNTTKTALPDLNSDDSRDIKVFANQYGHLMPQQQQQSTTVITPKSEGYYKTKWLPT